MDTIYVSIELPREHHERLQMEDAVSVLMDAVIAGNLEAQQIVTEVMVGVSKSVAAEQLTSALHQLQWATTSVTAADQG